MKTALTWLALSLTLSLSSLAGAAPLTVFAAASLTDALGEVGRAFDRASGNTTTFQFAGSQTLLTQLQQGARADVFASAGTAQFDPLLKSGAVTDERVFARNRLVIIAPGGNPTVKTLSDLAKPGVKLVVAGAAVPVGDYTRRMLAAVDAGGTYGPDFGKRVLGNVVSEETSVRQVALKVQLGEADAGVVYVSDVTPDLKKDVREVGVPTRFNPVARYPVGVLKDAGQPGAARAFVRFLLSPQGQRILNKWGFLKP